MQTQDKVRENRVRRTAQRLGLVLKKSRARSVHLNDLGGYMLVDAYLNAVVVGGRYDLDLEDVEAYLADTQKRLGAR